MPLKTHDHSERAFDQSTVALSVSSVSHQYSEKPYFDQEFTLNPVTKTKETKVRKNCLAFEVALTFPPKIKQQVVKMVDYYETVVEQQVSQFHKVIEQNNRLKKENERLKAQSQANLLCGFFKMSNYQIRQPLAVLKPSNKQENSQNILKKRLDELQKKLDAKDQKIVQLTNEISDMSPKPKRNKKKQNIYKD